MTRVRRTVLVPLAALAVAAVFAAGPAMAAPSVRAAEPAMREARADILIERDTEFDADRGVRSGSGTKHDPFVISGWRVGNLRIHDTMSWFTIRDVEVTGTMVLDWTGRGLRLVDSVINDLRVNQNVARSGRATTGLIARNRFRVIGQLRHWDGVFEQNLVGVPAGANGSTVGAQAVNFDGFNGARFRNNTIHGFVTATLHGHHHGSAFGMPSHEHSGSGMAPGHTGHGADTHVDHTRRYHEVWITGNTIHTTTDHALRWNDVGHVNNDRTNASETDPDLELPHQHWTRVHLNRNRLVGSGLIVDVFNAVDDLHNRTNRGLIEIRGNRIELRRQGLQGWFAGPDGIRINQVVDATVRVTGNQIVTEAADGVAAMGLFADFDQGAGIRLATLDKAAVYLDGNRVSNRPFGIVASAFTKSVTWWVRGLVTEGVGQDVAYDEASVENPPRRA